MFWILQFTGWALYGIAKYYLSGPVYQNINNAIIISLIGFSLSSILRFVYRQSYFKIISIQAIFYTIITSISAAFILVLTFDFIILQEYSWTLLLKGLLNKSFVFFTWSLIYFGIRLWREIQEQKSLVQHMSGMAKEAQLNMLRHQLNPHFLFNTLSGIEEMIDENQEKAKQMIYSLSDFLRYTLNKHHEYSITLKEEIEMLERYLELEQIRFEKRLLVSFDYSDAVLKYAIPTFILQPIIENALKHGFQQNQSQLSIHIEIKLENDMLHLLIINSGHLTSVNTDGYGLHHIAKRLNLHYDDQASFTIYENDNHVHVSIKVPLHENNYS